jgi:hypothetical protein
VKLSFLQLRLLRQRRCTKRRERSHGPWSHRTFSDRYQNEYYSARKGCGAMRFDRINKNWISILILKVKMLGIRSILVVIQCFDRNLELNWLLPQITEDTSHVTRTSRNRDGYICLIKNGKVK